MYPCEIWVHDLRNAVEHIPGLPGLMPFWVDDVSVAQTLRCGLTRGTLLGEHVLALILWVTAGGLPKTVLNWAVPHNY